MVGTRGERGFREKRSHLSTFPPCARTIPGLHRNRLSVAAVLQVGANFERFQPWKRKGSLVFPLLIRLSSPCGMGRSSSCRPGGTSLFGTGFFDAGFFDAGSSAGNRLIAVRCHEGLQPEPSRRNPSTRPRFPHVPNPFQSPARSKHPEPPNPTPPPLSITKQPSDAPTAARTAALTQ